MAFCDLRTVPPDNEGAIALAKSIKANGHLESIALASPQGLRPNGLCYWNVDATIEDLGRGRMVTGWQFLWWPEWYIIAAHHAVLELTDHSLLDVSATLVSDRTTKTTTFLRDPVKVDLRVGVWKEPRYYLLKRHPALDHLIRAGLDHHRSDGRLRERCVAYGYDHQEMFDRSRGLKPTGFAPSSKAQAIELLHLQKQSETARLSFESAIDRFRVAIARF